MDQEYPINIPSGIQTLHANELSTDIINVSDEVLQKAIICKETGKPYRIVEQELSFYKKHQIQLPQTHPDVRYKKRMSYRTNTKLYLRKCDSAGEQMLSIYPEDI